MNDLGGSSSRTERKEDGSPIKRGMGIKRIRTPGGSASLSPSSPSQPASENIDTGGNGGEEAVSSAFGFLSSSSSAPEIVPSLLERDQSTSSITIDEQPSAFSFLSSAAVGGEDGGSVPEALATAAALEGAKDAAGGGGGGNLSAFSFLLNASLNDADRAIDNGLSQSQGGGGGEQEQPSSSGFAFLHSYNAGGDDGGKEAKGQEEEQAQQQHQEDGGGSAFSFIPVPSKSSLDKLEGLGEGLSTSMKAAKGREGESSNYSAFNFLSSSSSPPPVPPLPSLPSCSSSVSSIPLDATAGEGADLLSSSIASIASSSTTGGAPPSQDKFSRLNDLMGLDATTTAASSSSPSSSTLPIPSPPSSASDRQNVHPSLLSLESGGGDGDRRRNGGGTSLTTAGLITFQKTATSRTNIKKKKASIKVGYARDDIDASNGGSGGVPTPPSAPNPSQPPPPVVAPTIVPTQPTTIIPSPSPSSIPPSAQGGGVVNRASSSSNGPGIWGPSTSSSINGVETALPIIVSADAASTPVRMLRPGSTGGGGSGRPSPSASSTLSASVGGSPSCVRKASNSIDGNSISNSNSSSDLPDKAPAMEKKNSGSSTNSAGGGGGILAFFGFGGGGVNRKDEKQAGVVPGMVYGRGQQIVPSNERGRVGSMEERSNGGRPIHQSNRPSSSNIGSPALTTALDRQKPFQRPADSTATTSNSPSTVPTAAPRGSSFSDDDASSSQSSGDEEGGKGAGEGSSSIPHRHEGSKGDSSSSSPEKRSAIPAASEPTPASYAPPGSGKAATASSSSNRPPVFAPFPTKSSSSSSTAAAAPPQQPQQASSRFIRSSSAQSSTTLPASSAVSSSVTSKLLSDLSTSKDPIERNKTQIELLIKTFQKDATNLCFRQQEVRRRQSKVATDKLTLQNEQSSFQEELRRYEAEQARHAEREEFERAEALQHVIEQVKAQSNARTRALQEITVEANLLERQGREARTEQRKLLDSLCRQLGEFLGARKEELGKFVADSQANVEAEKRRLVTEEERMAMEMRHVEKEEAAVKEETANVDAAIQAQTTDLVQQKTELESNIALVDEDIAKLEAALRAKRAEKEKIQEDLRGTEGEINKVRNKFERQLHRLNEKERALATSRQDCLAEEAVLTEQRKAYAASAAAIKAEEGRMKALVEQVSLELQVASTLVATFADQEVLQRDLVTDNGSSLSSSSASASGVISELQALQVEVAEAEKAKHVMTKEYEGLQSSLISLKEEVETIEIELPLLEAAKKEAAAAKNYKDAGAKMKEIKALTERRAEAETLATDSRQRLEEVKGLLAAGEETLHQALEKLNLKEKEQESQRVQLLANKARGLRKAKRAVGKVSGARIQTSAAILLQAELEASEGEANLLRKRYDIEAEPEEEEEDEENGGAGSQALSPTRGSDDGAGKESRETLAAGGEKEEEDDGRHTQAAACAEEVSSPSSKPKPTTVGEIGGGGGGEGGTGKQQQQQEGPPKAEDVARARELHIAILAMEEKLSTAVEVEDYEMAEELQATLDDLKGHMAELGTIDLVNLIMESDESDEGEGGQDEGGEAEVVGKVSSSPSGSVIGKDAAGEGGEEGDGGEGKDDDVDSEGMQKKGEIPGQALLPQMRKTMESSDR